MLEVTGTDVVAFCDGLIEEVKTSVDLYQETFDQNVDKAMKNRRSKQSFKSADGCNDLKQNL